MRRRQFLRSLPAAGAGTMLAVGGSAHEARVAEPISHMTIDVAVNGEPRTANVEVSETLADLVRNRLGLLGTKVACNQAACGACTVLLDGRAVLACHTLAIQSHHRSVTTIEGLSHVDRLHPLQEEFIAHDAVQCGFCTPGMILACAATLAHNPKASRAEIAEGIAGNACRCGAYLQILDAAEAARARLEKPGAR